MGDGEKVDEEPGVGGNEQRKGKDVERCRSREQIQGVKGKRERV